MTEELIVTSPLADRIGGLAIKSLNQEVSTWPKPGLVSPKDSGSHADMDASTFYASAKALQPFFVALANAGFAGARINDLRSIGQAAELAMLKATHGVNTHRGAIFGLGLLCAAAGAMASARHPLAPGCLGAWVRSHWGRSILSGPLPIQSHGTFALRRYGAGGARVEAAIGFPHVYEVGLPALKMGNFFSGGDENAARGQACFALMAKLEDTNLLYRNGEAGCRFVQNAARSFLAKGGVGQKRWEIEAERIHRSFVTRWLSPGGSADLLAATLLVHFIEASSITSAECRNCWL